MQQSKIRTISFSTLPDVETGAKLVRLSANLRKRRYRARQRLGKAVLSIEVEGYSQMVEILIRSGFIAAQQAEDRRAVAAAAAKVLHAWVTHWREHNN